MATWEIGKRKLSSCAKLLCNGKTVVIPFTKWVIHWILPNKVVMVTNKHDALDKL